MTHGTWQVAKASMVALEKRIETRIAKPPNTYKVDIFMTVLGIHST
jgi:hypothetical protein